MSFFTAEHIYAGYGKTPILRDISFSVDKGCIMGVLGANGSGKTTLIQTVCGILPHDGRCRLENVELESRSSREVARSVSYIPQRSGLSVDISAVDVVLMGFNPHLHLLEHPSKAMRETALRVLAEVGLEGCENQNYLHLSEGQKQLCILARTMVSESKLLLLDEPESALDFHHRYIMLEKIRNWVSVRQGCAIVTLHDPMLAMNYCDRLMLLHDGRILDILTPSEDNLEKMEQKLSVIYGSVSMQKCTNRKGRTSLVMLKEDL